MDPLSDIAGFLSAYHPLLHLARLQTIAQVLESSGGSKDALRAVVSRAIDVIVSSTTNVGLYREFVGAYFEKGIDVVVEPDVVRQMDARATATLDSMQDLIGRTQYTIEHTVVTSQAQVRETLVDQLLQLAKVHSERGDVQKAMKVLTQARQDSADLEALQLRVLEAQVLSCFQTTGHSPSAAMSYLQRIETMLSAPLVPSPPSARGAGVGVGQHRLSDAHFVFYTVANALCELDRKHYRAVAGALLRLNRYPPSQAASLAPQAAAEYAQQSASYFAHLPAHVEASQLTNLKDVVAIAILALFATHTRSEIHTVLGSGYIKGWLEEDAMLHGFVEHMMECKYQAALKGLGELIHHRMRFEVHSAAHINEFYGMIRASALEQYAAPFMTLSLPVMATAFAMPQSALERDLRELIALGRLRCRIDRVHQLLRQENVNTREDTIAKVSASGAHVVHQRLMCARALSLMRNDVVLKATMEGRRQVQQEMLACSGMGTQPGAGGAVAGLPPRH